MTKNKVLNVNWNLICRKRLTLCSHKIIRKEASLCSKNNSVWHEQMCPNLSPGGYLKNHLQLDEGQITQITKNIDFVSPVAIFTLIARSSTFFDFKCLGYSTMLCLSVLVVHTIKCRQKPNQEILMVIENIADGIRARQTERKCRSKGACTL